MKGGVIYAPRAKRGITPYKLAITTFAYENLATALQVSNPDFDNLPLLYLFYTYTIYE